MHYTKLPQHNSASNRVTETFWQRAVGGPVRLIRVKCDMYVRYRIIEFPLEAEPGKPRFSNLEIAVSSYLAPQVGTENVMRESI